MGVGQNVNCCKSRVNSNRITPHLHLIFRKQSKVNKIFRLLSFLFVSLILGCDSDTVILKQAKESLLFCKVNVSTTQLNIKKINSLLERRTILIVFFCCNWGLV